MSSPTKADLTAAVAKLTKENKGLRDLLGAVSLVADTVPVAAAGVPDWRELRRSAHVLSAVKVVANPAGSWAWGHATGHAAKHLREVAAEPVGYEVYAEPEPGDCGHPLTGPDGRACTCGRPPHGPEYAHEAWTADGTRVLDPVNPATLVVKAEGAPEACDDPRCECGHQQTLHDDADDSDAGAARHECLAVACACATFRVAASVTA